MNIKINKLFNLSKKERLFIVGFSLFPFAVAVLVMFSQFTPYKEFFNTAIITTINHSILFWGLLIAFLGAPLFQDTLVRLIGARKYHSLEMFYYMVSSFLLVSVIGILAVLISSIISIGMYVTADFLWSVLAIVFRAFAFWIIVSALLYGFGGRNFELFVYIENKIKKIR